MPVSISRSGRRIGVLVNYVGLVMSLLTIYLGRYLGWHNLFTVVLAATLLVTLVTFFRYHVRTGLWRLVHTGVENLDERQRQVAHESLRHSYSVFSIVVLAILLWQAVASQYDPNLIFIFAALLYLAHTLPSSILAWIEKEV